MQSIRTQTAKPQIARPQIARDQIDRQLIGLLLENARAPTSELARRLGIGRTTVHERIARLERGGLITGYSAILSRDPLEEQARAFVMISIEQKAQSRVLDRLHALPEIRGCYTVSGGYDLLASVEAPRLDDIDAVLDEILGIPGVERCQSWLVMAAKFERQQTL